MARSLLRLTCEDVTGHDQFKSAVWQFCKRDAGTFERLVDANKRQVSRLHRRLFETMNRALCDLRLPAEFGLTPTQHRPRRSHSGGERLTFGLASLPRQSGLGLFFHLVFLG